MVFLAESLAAWQSLGVLPPWTKNVRWPDKNYNGGLGGHERGAPCWLPTWEEGGWAWGAPNRCSAPAPCPDAQGGLMHPSLAS